VNQSPSPAATEAAVFFAKKKKKNENQTNSPFLSNFKSLLFSSLSLIFLRVACYEHLSSSLEIADDDLVFIIIF